MYRLGELSRFGFPRPSARFFLLEILIMNIQFDRYIVAVGKALESNAKVGVALKAFKPIYDKATPEKQFEYRLAVGTLIGKHYECETRESVYRGEKTIAWDGDDKELARAAMKYYFPLKPRKATDNKSDPVAELLKKFNALSAGEKRRFLKAI